MNRDLAYDSRELAVAAKSDSNAMKSISIITMVFLPGTFVAVCSYMSLDKSLARVKLQIEIREFALTNDYVTDTFRYSSFRGSLSSTVGLLACYNPSHAICYRILVLLVSMDNEKGRCTTKYAVRNIWYFTI